MGPLDISQNSDVYYHGDYWNDIDCTVRMINRTISGDDRTSWWRHFAARTGRVFDRALILNCGNGWVEREMLDAGFIKESVGVDCSPSLLDQARSAAGQRPAHYVEMNVNTDRFPELDFDLVVNHAAAHHVTRLDRVLQEVCGLLPDDGWLISFDYVGPHRNQYHATAWDTAWNVNRELPPHLRQEMEYPRLAAMLVVDPTEAVHSELILETTGRYFSMDELTPLGGAIAYPVLTHNSRLFAAERDEREKWAQFVLDRDAEFLDAHPDSSLFAYFTGQPNRDALHDRDRLAEWRRVEDAREARALASGGEYFERSLLRDVYEEIDRLRLANDQARAELGAIRNSYLYSHLTKVLDAPLSRRALDTRTAGYVLRALKSTRASSRG